jgi:hypothetical protein
MSSYGEAADFTTGNSNPVVCQCCLQPFKDGTELCYMQDRKPDQGGGEESVRDVISTTSERQRLMSPNSPQVCLHL